MREKGLRRFDMFIVCILVVSFLVSTQPHVAAPLPRHDKGLEIHFYNSRDEAFAALSAGEIDIMQYYLTKQQYETATQHPNLLLAGYDENVIYEFDINNNYTVQSGFRSPTHEVTFRQALAHMVDKNWIINDVLEGFGRRIDAFVPASQSGYVNQSVVGENYPYPYNLTRAAELLDIYFADTDGDGIRNYSVGWDGRESGPNLDPILVWIRFGDPKRSTIGQALADTMQVLGIPVSTINSIPNWPPTVWYIYTGGWSIGSSTPAFLYWLFHSQWWGSSNTVTGMNASNLPNYPDLDKALANLYFATSMEEFKYWVEKATGLMVNYCVNIPLWSRLEFWAYSRLLTGIVNMDGMGLENSYTFLNVRKIDDPDNPNDESQEPIKMGTVQAPVALNVLYSSWYYDYAVLDRVFSYLLAVQPYNLAEDSPWVAQDWEVSTWYDPQDAEIKTKVTYWMRKDVFWRAPVTGELVRQFTAHDVEFTIWYIYAFECWAWHNFKNVHHTKVVDDFTIEVYFDTNSFWLQYNPTGPLLPRDEYLSLLCGISSATFYSDGANCTESTRYVFTDEPVVKVTNANIDTTPLLEGVDFEILATSTPNYTHNEIHFLTNLPAGSVTIDYYTPTVDPEGYYLADLDWTQTFYSIGPYYSVDIVPGVYGYAVLGCNPSHFLGAPLLGEINWMWTFNGTDKPRSGYYQVNLFDAVKLLTSYCSRGDAIPDGNWFPGADLDQNDIGHVGLYDAVTILVNYGKKFGTPPD